MRKYMITWTANKVAPEVTMQKFLAEGFGKLPATMKVTGSWHGLNGNGWVLVEGSSATDVYAALTEWSGSMSYTCEEVMTDQEVLPSMKAHIAKHHGPK